MLCVDICRVNMGKMFREFQCGLPRTSPDIPAKLTSGRLAGNPLEQFIRISGARRLIGLGLQSECRCVLHVVCLARKANCGEALLRPEQGARPA